MKQISIFITSIVICTAVAFWIGKTSNSLKVIEEFSQNLQQMRTACQALEQKVVQQLGVDLSEKQHVSEEVLARAEQFIQQNDLATAGIYFIHGMSKDPGNWQLIHEYGQTIVNYSQSLHDNGEDEKAMAALSELGTFMESQAQYIHLSDVPKLEEWLDQIDEYKQTIEQAMITKNHSESMNYVRSQLAQAKQLVQASTSLQGDIGNIQEHVNTLNEILFSLRTLDLSMLQDDTLSVEITNSIALIEKTVQELEEQIVENQANSEAVYLAEQAQKFLHHAQQEPLHSELILYYLTSAESIISQLVFRSLDTQQVKSLVLPLLQELEQAKKHIGEQKSEIVWKTIEQSFQTLQDTNYPTIEEHLIALLEFQRELIDKSSNLPSQTFLEKARILANELNTTISRRRQQQLELYNQWAMSRIQELYNNYKDEEGVGTNEQALYHGILSYLGSIETKYLSLPVQTAYNEVFNRFYSELANEQKIPISAEMMLKRSKPLSDF